MGRLCPARLSLCAECELPEARFGARTWPVDFLLVSPAMARFAQSGPYTQAMDQSGQGRALSDHCPVVVEFAF